MPRGYQWSWSEIRNAERMAKMQAEAMREAFRKENSWKRRAPETRVVEKVVYVEAPRKLTPEEDEASKALARREVDKFHAECHAKRALEAEFGSESYLYNRYWFSWRRIVEDYQRKYKCSAPQARQIIVWTYTEESFERYEDERIEKLMGHRNYG